MATKGDFLSRISDLQPELDALGDKRYSEVIDDEGHQYLDLVMEGGGTLGIALLGYIYVLEQVGLRFIGIGGAVSAIALAASGQPAEERLGNLIEPLANLPMEPSLTASNQATTMCVRPCTHGWRGGPRSRNCGPPPRCWTT